MSRRAVTALGLVAAGGVGYYLYNAGGDPKVAQKQAEADVHKASAKIKSEIPGRANEAEKKGEALASQAGSKVDSASKDAQAELKKAQAAAQDYKDRTGKELNKAIDKFDATIEKKTAEAKSGISSWFGGK